MERMAVFLPIHEHHGYMSSLLSGDDHLKLKLSDEDFLSPLLPKRIRRHLVSSPYARPGHYKGKTALATSDKNFQVNVDVQQFSPDEISVKVVDDDTIVVECKHEEKKDEHGYVSRHFIRKYKVPKGYDTTKCISKLSSDGVLTIMAPKVSKTEKGEVEIPITFTNQPSNIQNVKNDTTNEGQSNEMEQQ